MSLQNKANALFGAQPEEKTDEVEDIFEQYGVGDSAAASDGASAQTMSDATASASTVAGSVPSSDDTTRERAWEKEFEQKHTAQPMPAPHYAATPPQAPPPTAPSGTLPQEEEKSRQKSVSAPETAMSTPKPAAAPPDLPKVAPIVSPQPQPAPAAPSAPVAPNQQRELTPKQPARPRSSSPQTTMPSAQESDDTSPRYAEPVAAPVVRNINAIMENIPDAREKRSAPPRPAAPQPQRLDPSKKTILIADDDVDTLEMYATIFENAGYNVLRATDGLEAINITAAHVPHVIFTGIVMPRMDGFTMIDALRQNPRTSNIPVVINSHLGRDADKKRAEELGVRDFIVRGFTTPREAVERIGALLLRSDYIFRFDVHDPEARKLLRDLGDDRFFTCPRGQEMAIKLTITDPRDLTFSARFSCVDIPKDKNKK